MVEDMAANLAPAAAMGVTTVWLRDGAAKAGASAGAGHVDFVEIDLKTFLRKVIP